MYRAPNNDEAPASNKSNQAREPNPPGNRDYLNGITPQKKNAFTSGSLKRGTPRDRNTDTHFHHLWMLAKNGDSNALNRLTRLIAPELERIAQVLLSKERADHTFSTNALINELYVRLLGNELITIQDRSHFLALAAKRMRFILIDHARKKRNQKNNNGQKAFSLDETFYDRVRTNTGNVDDILDIDKALSELEKYHTGWAQVVELRYFGGCQFSEIAEIMNINKRRAERYWTRARIWLYNYLKGTDYS